MLTRVRFTLRLLGALCMLAGLLLLPLVASAHEEVDSGDYALEIGWINEPVLVGELNGLDLYVASKDNPDEGIAGIATLTFTVEYGGVSKSYEIVPVEEEDGHYTAAFVPTREGQYAFHLTGMIEGQSIDVQVEPEEVVAPGELAFPEVQPSTADLSAQLAGARAQARTAEVIAFVGVVFGLIGIGGVAVVRRKS